ncbi:hypothetical protein BS17DRAFT_789382, partial [Gyrodon lividus]
HLTALPATQMPQTMPFGLPGPAGPYGYPPLVIFLLPWGIPGYQGANQMFPSSPYNSLSSYPTQSPIPMPPSLYTCSPSPLPGPSTSAQAAEIPDIISWSAHLDSCFLCRSQLWLEYFRLADLQEWLGIGVETAVLIMQYAKEGLEAIKSGRWIFPKAK